MQPGPPAQTHDDTVIGERDIGHRCPRHGQNTVKCSCDAHVRRLSFGCLSNSRT
jgi:hypothetical protein